VCAVDGRKCTWQESDRPPAHATTTTHHLRRKRAQNTCMHCEVCRAPRPCTWRHPASPCGVCEPRVRVRPCKHAGKRNRKCKETSHALWEKTTAHAHTGRRSRLAEGTCRHKTQGRPGKGGWGGVRVVVDGARMKSVSSIYLTWFKQTGVTEWCVDQGVAASVSV
jgi:hypothetical protein